MDVYTRRKFLESNMATLQVKVARLKRKDVLLITRQKHLRLRFLEVMAGDTIPDSRPTSDGGKISTADVSHGTDNPSSRRNSVFDNSSTKCNNVIHRPSSKYRDLTDKSSSRFVHVTEKSSTRYSDVTDKSLPRYIDVADKSLPRYADEPRISCPRYSDEADKSLPKYNTEAESCPRYTDVSDKSSLRYSDVSDKPSLRYSPERPYCYGRTTENSPQEYTRMQICRNSTGGNQMFSNEASRSCNVKGLSQRYQDARAFKLKKYRSTPALNNTSHRNNNPEPRTTYDLQPSHCLRNRQYHSMDNSYRYPARSREITNNAPNTTSASYDSSSSDSNYDPCQERDSGGQGFLSRRSSGYESDVTSSNGDDPAAVPTLRRAVSVACVQGRQPILNILLSDRVKCSWC